MKLSVNSDNKLSDTEIIINCPSIDANIQKIIDIINDSNNQSIAFYKNNNEYFLDIDDILFFETDNDVVCAHTANDTYSVKQRLYELELIIPKSFVRISKSAIINVNKIFSVTKYLTSSNLLEFYNSHKQVFVSRFYYNNLKQKLEERRKNEI